MMKTKLLLAIAIPMVSMGQIFNPYQHRDIDHDPAYKRSIMPIREKVSACRINREGQEYNLNQTDFELEEVFKLIETVPTGQMIIHEIRQLVEKRELRIANLSSLIRQQRGLSKKTAALYDFTLETPTIYINFEDEIGLAAHFFFHEAIHALDDLIEKEYEVEMVYYRAFKEFQKLFGLDLEPMKELSEYETNIMNEVWQTREKYRQRHSYRAERLAFDEQGVFTKEILTPKDCYREYIDEHREVNGLKLFIYTPDDHIFNSYRIQKKYLQ